MKEFYYNTMFTMYLYDVLKIVRYIKNTNFVLGIVKSIEYITYYLCDKNNSECLQCFEFSLYSRFFFYNYYLKFV